MEKELMPAIMQAQELIRERRYKECEAVICAAMFEYPHDAVPHNLMGLLLESRNCHVEAMKHFRASYALDPTYKPAAWNLDCFGSFTRPHPCAYFEEDCRSYTKPKLWDGEDTCTS